MDRKLDVSTIIRNAAYNEVTSRVWEYALNEVKRKTILDLLDPLATDFFNPVWDQLANDIANDTL